MNPSIRIREGDLFQSSAQTLVNTVNCVGVMGKGIALEFRSRFPVMYREYVQRCEHGEVKLGQPYLYRDLTLPWVINFPTKDHWRSVSRLDDIVDGLRHLKDHVAEWGVESIAVPPLGCGNGGLEWSVVGPTLYRHLSQLSVPVELYAPHGTPPAQLTPAYLTEVAGEGDGQGLAIRTGRVDPGWIALVEILSRIVAQPYHWPVGRIMLQKIAYFATVLGIPTSLSYARGSFGPFSAELKLILSKLANNGLVTERRHGSRIEVDVGPTWEDARSAYIDAISQWDETIELVADFMSRMTVHEAEIASTIHFATAELSDHEIPAESQVLKEVMAWKQRRNPAWEEVEVALMIRHLAILGVINVRPTDELTISDEALLGFPDEVAYSPA
jgi:uncharacterized protein YwgA/O-acetyl-ADP-ribose deacetylase (regulator of RNase III)